MIFLSINYNYNCRKSDLKLLVKHFSHWQVINCCQLIKLLTVSKLGLTLICKNATANLMMLGVPKKSSNVLEGFSKHTLTSYVYQAALCSLFLQKLNCFNTLKVNTATKFIIVLIQRGW